MKTEEGQLIIKEEPITIYIQTDERKNTKEEPIAVDIKVEERNVIIEKKKDPFVDDIKMEDGVSYSEKGATDIEEDNIFVNKIVLQPCIQLHPTKVNTQSKITTFAWRHNWLVDNTCSLSLSLSLHAHTSLQSILYNELCQIEMK